MAAIKPFAAVRPIKGKEKQIASLPYDVYSNDEAVCEAKDNPYSFLHIGKAEVDTTPADAADENAVFEKAAENLKKFISDGILVRENKPCLYIYRLEKNGHTQTGIVSCVSLDDYRNGIIKKHELTRTKKVIERYNYIKYCKAQTGPIYLTYRPNEKIRQKTEEITSSSPLYDFVSYENVRHTVWKVENSQSIADFAELFSAVNSVYIADGHHRMEAAEKYSSKVQSFQNSGGEFNYCMSVLFPSDELRVYEYNRLIKDLNGLDTDAFLQKLSEKFYIMPKNDGIPFRPFMPRQFGMLLFGKWYMLTLADDTEYGSVVKNLDVSILQNEILAPLLGIDDPQTNERISFISGSKGLDALEKTALVENYGIAFSLYPPSVDDIFSAADSGETVPPKSTWFEPKLLSGLFVHEI